MADEHAEGWYTDPFGRHEARWMSDGQATKLVRDDGVESYDAPPDEEPSQEATMIVEEQATDGQDLRRAGEPDDAATPQRMGEAAQFGATWGSHIPMPGPQDRR